MVNPLEAAGRIEQANTGITIETMEKDLALKFIKEEATWRLRQLHGGTEPAPSLDTFILQECLNANIPPEYVPIFRARIDQVLKHQLNMIGRQNSSTSVMNDPQFEVPGDHISDAMARQLIGAYKLTVRQGRGKNVFSQDYDIDTVYPYNTVGVDQCVKSFDGRGLNEGGERRVRQPWEWYIWKQRIHPIVTVVADTSNPNPDDPRTGYRPVVKIETVTDSHGNSFNIKQLLSQNGFHNSPTTDALIRQLDGQSVLASGDQMPVLSLSRQEQPRFPGAVRGLRAVKDPDDKTAASDGCRGRMSFLN